LLDGAEQQVCWWGVLGEEALPLADHRREYHEAVLVDQVVIGQRVNDADAAGDDDVLVGQPSTLVRLRDATSFGMVFHFVANSSVRLGQIFANISHVVRHLRASPARCSTLDVPSVRSSP
jgi:hypothetical protein